MMLHLKQVLDASELAQARQWLMQGDWVDGRVTSGNQPATLKRNRQLPEQSPTAAPLQALVRTALQRNQLFFSAALPRRMVTPLFNRYDAGGDHLADHVDVAMRYQPDGTRVRTDLSCTLFLSGPDEYQGGDLVVLEHGQERRFRLPAGDMLLYPGSHVHRVEPVHTGVRLASFFWIESMVRSLEQRRILFDMDCQLMSLRSRLAADDTAITGLTGTYHNLLRMWGDS